MKTGDFKTTSKSESLLLPAALIAVVLLLELLAVSISVDALTLRDTGGVLALVLSYAGQLSKLLLVFLIAFFILTASQLKEYIQLLNTSRSIKLPWRWLLLQWLAFSIFYFLTTLLFSGDSVGISTEISAGGSSSIFLALLWLFAAFSIAITSFLFIGPLSVWLKILRKEKLALGIAVLVSFLTLMFANVTQQFWQPMAKSTFVVSQWFLSFYSTDILVNESLMQLGVNDFIVNIAPACSGYEGVGLIMALTGLYLWVFKQEFIFPRALLLFPIGIASIWLLNALRIAVLIIIGAAGYPKIALEGFHSQAGWIFFIAVAVGLLLLAHRINYFSRIPVAVGNARSPEGAMATVMLAPLLALLATILITSAFTAGFDWLYPLRFIVVAAVTVLFWRHYKFTIKAWRLEPFVIGLIVFVLWLWLVPHASEQSEQFSATLFEQPLYISIGWIIFRVLGAAITVPIAEELVFRGYLLSRLSKHSLLDTSPIAFQWLAFLLSSILFGVLHGDWLAGFIAGMFYALARYRRGSVGDAIVAHMTTNALLSAYVIVTGSWALW